MDRHIVVGAFLKDEGAINTGSSYILLGFIGNQIIAQITVDSTFYYNPDSSKTWWYIQEDAFAFRLNNGIEYTGSYDTEIIDNIEYINSVRKQNVVKFKTNSIQLDINILQQFLFH